MSHFWARLFYKRYCVRYENKIGFLKYKWFNHQFEDYTSARRHKAFLENQGCLFVELYAVNKYGELKKVGF